MAEGIDIARLGERLRRVRLQRGLTLREVKDATGISVSTLSRIERGASKDLDSATLLTLAEWMGMPVEKLKDKPAPVVRSGKVVEETPDIVELHLRADKKLDQKTAAALSNLFRTAYDQLRKQGKKG